MRRVQLDHVEARFQPRMDGGDELVANRVHIGAGHRPRHLIVAGSTAPRDAAITGQLPLSSGTS